MSKPKGIAIDGEPGGSPAEGRRPNGRSDWRRTLRRWRYTLFTAPWGRGRPETQSRWDEEYRQGHWDRLDSAAQVAHYAVIAGYAHHFFSSAPRVLDVGCGHGRLFHFLRHFPFDDYVGLDLSSAAIEKAAAVATPKARFEVANFEEWSAPAPFDVIIFNESIYYARHPVDELKRYATMLAPKGLIIVSMVQGSLNWGVARKIRRQFSTLHSTLVRNEEGETWEVRALVPPAPATPSA